MKMDRLQIHFDYLRPSIRRIFEPKRLFLWRCQNRLRFAIDSDSDSGTNPEPITEPIPIPKLIPESIPEPIPILEPTPESIPETDSGLTIRNRFQKTLDVAGIDSNETSFFPSLVCM